MALSPTIQRITDQLKADGPAFLSEQDCCALVTYQLDEIAKWQQVVWDTLWGPGGGGNPPPPPTWPPK
jgi:hypothetical protein